MLITNWHKFALDSPHAESGKSYVVVDKGEESPDAFARRVTAADASQFPDHFMAAPQDLDACDAAQACRVVEGLRAWVGRDFYAAGINPRTFVIPHNAIAQVNAQARRHVANRQAVAP